MSNCRFVFSTTISLACLQIIEGMIEKNELSWNICGFKRFNYFFIVLYLIGIYCQTFLFDFVIVFLWKNDTF